MVLFLACADDDAPGVDGGETDSGTPDADAIDASGEDSSTSDASGSDAPASDAGVDAPPPPGTIPVIVGVGWQGLRVVSIDEGLTWCQTGIMEDPHDHLFRGAGYHDGLFVGAHAGEANRGAIIVSTNGYAWEALHRTNFEPELPENPSGQWYGGAAWGNDVWMAAGGCGRLARSSDGREWESVPRFVDTCLHIRSLAFGAGMFVAGLDDDTWWSSADGDDWELFMSDVGSTVVWNGSELTGEIDGERIDVGRGICLSAEGWEGAARIFRGETTDCSDRVEVATTAHTIQMFVYGHAPAADYEPGVPPADVASCLGL